MQLGISSWAYQWLAGRPGHPPDNPLTPQQLIRNAHALGVQVVQIADNLPLHTFSDEVIEDFGAIAKQHDIQIELGLAGIELDTLRRYLELAQQLDVSLVRTNFPRPRDEIATKHVVEQLKTIASEYAGADIKLAIENYDKFPTSELAQIIRLVDSEYVGACLDPGNSLSCNEGTAHVINMLAPLTFNLHVKDIFIQREPYNMGFVVEGRACGQGQIDIPTLIESVQGLAPHDFNAVLECWTPWQGSLEESLQLEERWIHDSITYLRTLIPN